MKKRLSVKSIADALTRNRGMVAIAARNLGCARSTIYEWMEAHPELKTVLAEEREMMTDVAELSLYKQVQNGEGWAVKYYLSAQAKDRGYVETTNFKHSGDKENPLRAEVHYDISDADLDRELLRIAERTGRAALADRTLPMDTAGEGEPTPPVR